MERETEKCKIKKNDEISISPAMTSNAVSIDLHEAN